LEIAFVGKQRRFILSNTPNTFHLRNLAFPFPRGGIFGQKPLPLPPWHILVLGCTVQPCGHRVITSIVSGSSITRSHFSAHPSSATKNTPQATSSKKILRRTHPRRIFLSSHDAYSSIGNISSNVPHILCSR